MKTIPLQLNVDVNDLRDAISFAMSSPEETFELIKGLEEDAQDWELTYRLAVHFVNLLKGSCEHLYRDYDLSFLIFENVPTIDEDVAK